MSHLFLLSSCCCDHTQLGAQFGGVGALHVSFHRRQYTLGEHYNSVVPAQQQVAAAGTAADGGWTVVRR
jgi:hypothetical protein